MIEATIPDARLAHLAAYGSPHLRPLYAAMRGGRIGFLFVSPGKGRFHPPAGRPFVAIVGDDTDRARGPSGFHAKSVRRLARAAHGVTVISCAILPDVYATAAQVAALGRNVLIVETQPEQEAPWVEFVREAAPSASFLLCTTFEGTA